MKIKRTYLVKNVLKKNYKVEDGLLINGFGFEDDLEDYRAYPEDYMDIEIIVTENVHTFYDEFKDRFPDSYLVPQNDTLSCRGSFCVKKMFGDSSIKCSLEPGGDCWKQEYKGERYKKCIK